MPNLKILSPVVSRKYAGRKGLGVRAFCKAAMNSTGWGLGPQLVALRNLQGPQIVTNAIVGSHTESAGGYVEADAGLRDAGAIEFDANFVPEYAAWQRFNDQFALSPASGNRVPSSFMGGLFGTAANELNRKGDTLEDPTAHLFELSIAMPNTLTLLHVYGFPSMFGPMVAAMESIIMSQFSFKISGAPSMMRPLATIRYDSNFAAGAQAASKVIGGPRVITPSLSTSSGIVPAVAFGADSVTYGGLAIAFDSGPITALTNQHYASSAGHYMLRVVYPGEYEIFSDVVQYDGNAATLAFGDSAALTGWPNINFPEYKDNFTDFRRVMGNIGGTRKAGLHIILYRCDWLEE